MKYNIIVFKSKTEVFRFIEEMQDNGVNATAVGTPSHARIGCGISAKIEYRYLWLAKKIISNGNYNSFYRIYTK